VNLFPETVDFIDRVLCEAAKVVTNPGLADSNFRSAHGSNLFAAAGLRVWFVRARQEIIELTFERVKYWFTTDFPYHMLWQ
jgi:hypothetical protein